MLIGANDADLAEEREIDIVSRRAEVRDFVIRAGLLATEVVRRKAQDLQTFRPLVLNELLQALVLWSESALRCDVDDQEHLPMKLSKARGGAVDTG